VTDEKDKLIAQLQTALDHRTTIAAAMGMLMERFGCTQDEAFDRLRKVSSIEQRKLFEVASEFLTTRGFGVRDLDRRRRLRQDDDAFTDEVG
jgi:AmiR/NasT family two-component response regulator